MPRTRVAVLIVALFAAVAGVIAAVMWLGSHGTTTPMPSPTASVTASPSASATPSTPAPPSATPSPTETSPVVTPSPATPSQPDNRASVTPFITNAIYDPAAGTVTVFSFVPGSSEASGTCTATFTDGASTVSGKSTASFDVSNTTCGPIALNVPSAPSSSATATVTFESTTSVGASSPAKVTK